MNWSQLHFLKIAQPFNISPFNFFQKPQNFETRKHWTKSKSITSISIIIDGNNPSSITHRNDYDGGNGDDEGGGGVAKLRLFKWVRIYAANRERAGWKIQTDRRNKSKFLPGTNPQVSGFWIFFLLIGERPIWTVHTLQENMSCFCVDMNHHEMRLYFYMYFLDVENVYLCALCKYMWISR